MTRKQRIQKAKAFTEREGGLEALAKNYLFYFEEGYIEASENELLEKHVPIMEQPNPPDNKVVWAFNGDGIATTEF